MRWLIRVLGWTMVWSGLFLLGYVGYQVGATNLANRGVQAEAQEDFKAALPALRRELPPVVTAPETEAVLHPEEGGAEGDVIGVLRIPKLELDRAMFEGTGRDTLKQGPGHLAGTSFPGQPGNAVVSGHRTTYGAPFFALDKLSPGDSIFVETAVGTHTYAVRESIIVSPRDVWVAENRPGAWLTLTTCNPIGSARERLVVFAEMTDGPNEPYVLAQAANPAG